MSAAATPLRRAPLRPARPRATAATAAALALACLVARGTSPGGLVAAAGAAVLVWLAALDLQYRLLPNRIVLPATLAVFASEAALAPARAPERALAAGAAALLLLLPALLRPGSLGMGDVKLALLLGALLGRTVATALAIAFLALAAVATALLARRGKAALKRELPLAPFLALGAIVTLLASHG